MDNRTIKEKKNELAAIEELKTLGDEFEKGGCACLRKTCNCADEFEENERILTAFEGKVLNETFLRKAKSYSSLIGRV